MGRCHICKNTTNLYCLNHDKHICINCINEHHKECSIVDYAAYVEGTVEKDNKCNICNEEIFEGDEIIRLPCLDIVHKDCIVKQLNSVQIPENEVFNDIMKCNKCGDDVFTEEHKEHVMMKVIAESLKNVDVVKKYFGIKDDEETTQISFQIDDDENIVGTQTIGKKENETVANEEKKQEHVDIDIDVDDENKKNILKDMDGDLVLSKKFTMTLRTKILIVVLVICFLFLLKSIFNN